MSANGLLKMSELAGTSRDTKLVGVSASGFAASGLDIELGPDDLLAAWAPRSA